MLTTIDRIIKGDGKILEYYQRALAIWEEIMSKPEAKNEDTLAEVLCRYQITFEVDCGGGDRVLGQEIMAVSGIARYSNDTAFDADSLAKAQLVYNAFIKSRCSSEVIGFAERVAKAYNLND